MKRQALVDSSARNVRPRVLTRHRTHEINRRLGTTVGGYYLEPNITDHINAYLGPNEANIQGLSQALPVDLIDQYELFDQSRAWRIRPWAERHVGDSDPAIQPTGPFTPQYLIDAPPPSRGPGGRNRTRREERRRFPLYNPLEDDDEA